MKLTVITPDKLAYEGDVLFVALPGSDGSFQILKNHAAIVSTLADGKVVIRESKKDETTLAIKGGVVEARDNTVTVLAEGILS